MLQTHCYYSCLRKTCEPGFASSSTCFMSCPLPIFTVYLPVAAQSVSNTSTLEPPTSSSLQRHSQPLHSEGWFGTRLEEWTSWLSGPTTFQCTKTCRIAPIARSAPTGIMLPSIRVELKHRFRSGTYSDVTYVSDNMLSAIQHANMCT